MTDWVHYGVTVRGLRANDEQLTLLRDFIQAATQAWIAQQPKMREPGWDVLVVQEASGGSP